MVPPDDAKKELMWAVQALACDAAVQLALFPDFTCKPGELALDFDNWYQATKHRQHLGLSEEDFSALGRIDERFELMSPERFTEEAVVAGRDWQDVRELARAVLLRLGWPVERAPSGRNIYVGPPSSQDESGS